MITANLPPRGALIVGGTHGGLGMARSLGRHGVPVGLVSDSNVITVFSRYVRFCEIWPGPARDTAAAELVALAKTRDLTGWVLLPGGDAEAELIARNREQLARCFCLTTPDWDTARWALDKNLTYQRAATLGIPHPQVFRAANRQQVVDLHARFPVVLKPATHWRSNAFTLGKAWRADDKAELLAHYDEALSATGRAGDIVLQEFIPGNGTSQFSYAALWRNGQPVASLTARRLRQFPIHFGYTSTFVETVVNKPIEEAAEKFLRSLDYSGLVEIEFKYDERTGDYLLLDVNIRSWTWIALASRAGADFPYLLWQLCNGERVAGVKGRPGIAWMHAFRDVFAGIHEAKAGRMSLLDYVRSLRASTEFAAFAWDDPVPGLIDVPLLASRIVMRRLPSLIRRSTRGIFGRERVAEAN